MSEFEKARKDFHRDLDHQPYADPTYLTNVGLSVVADGLAELIALLRPAVETITAKAEPVAPRGNGYPCSALLPGGHGKDRCVLPRGHSGMCSTLTGQLWDAEARPDAD